MTAVVRIIVMIFTPGELMPETGRTCRGAAMTAMALAAGGCRLGADSVCTLERRSSRR